MSTTLRTEAQRDVNYLSLNRSTIVWFAGRDDWHYADAIPSPCHLLPHDSKAFESILKLSDRHDTRIFGLRVAQGKENSIDINNESSHIVLEGDIGVEGLGGEQVITIKGGSHHIRIAGTVYSVGEGGRHVEIGAWSDQSTEPSGDLDFGDLRHVAGQPLTFVLIRVRNPIRAALGKPTDIKLPPGAKVLFWTSIGEQVAWWAKWLAVKVGFYGKGRR